MSQNINTVATSASITGSDYLLISQNGSALKRVDMDDVASQIYSNGVLISNVADTSTGVHNSIARGKNLGTFTDAHSAEISSGRFTDMFIGDYFTDSSNRKWRIAHFDPMYRCGDTQLTKHHIAVVPDTSLYNAQMQNTDTGAYIAGSEHNYTTGGYVASDMRKTNLAQATTLVESAFGASHVLTYRDLLTTSATSTATGWAWTDCKVELMSEMMVYGAKVWANAGYDVCCMNFQLALFRYFPALIHTRYTYWLRGIASSTTFANVNSYGYSNTDSASSSYGVRPLALIS